MAARLYAVAGTVLGADVALPELEPADAGDPEIVFEMLPEGEPAGEAVAWIRQWDIPGDDEGPWALFAKQGPDWLVRFPSQGDFRIAGDGRRITCQPRPGIPEATLRHLLLDQLLPLALSQRGRFVLHASAVAIGGRAVGFAGMSGSGKSTLAAAFADHGAALLCDDCLVLAEEEGAWQALPYYAGLRLWPDAAGSLGVASPGAAAVAHYTPKIRIAGEAGMPFRHGPAPLAALYFLREEGDEVSVKPLSAREAFLALVESSFVLDANASEPLKGQFEAVGRLAAAVPCHILNYPYRFEVLPAVTRLLLDRLGPGTAQE
jgi:hypothetical protein